MKIVHIEEFFHPDAGYQVNLLSRLQQIDGHDVTVVTAELDKIPSTLTAFFGKDDIEAKDGRFTHETGVKIVRSALLGFYSGRAIFIYPRLFKKVARLKPDVVFVHCEDTLTGMLFILGARWLKFPIVLDCHMVEMASLNRFRNLFRAFYKRFITPVILRENIPLIRVVDSDYVQKCLGIPLSHTELLSFGTDTLHFSPNREARRAIRARYSYSEESFLVLYAGKLDDTKGGRFLAEAIQSKLVGRDGREIEFLIIGNSGGSYGAELERILASSENKIVRLPTQRYSDLAKYYQAADIAVFPKQCSMSFFEVQSCGLPVLLEENEINNLRVLADNGLLFVPGSKQDFRSKIELLASLPRERIEGMGTNARKYVLANYDYVPIARKFTDVLQRTADAWREKRRAG